MAIPGTLDLYTNDERMTSPALDARLPVDRSRLHRLSEIACLLTRELRGWPADRR